MKKSLNDEEGRRGFLSFIRGKPKQKEKEAPMQPEVQLPFIVRNILQNGLMVTISNGYEIRQAYVDPDFLALGERLSIGDEVHISGKVTRGHTFVTKTAKIIPQSKAFPYHLPRQANET
ncbi:MAG: hypothetical protein AAFN93_21400 [Bacteroidota bacterium]